MPHNVASDLGLHCLQSNLKSVNTVGVKSQAVAVKCFPILRHVADLIFISFWISQLMLVDFIERII